MFKLKKVVSILLILGLFAGLSFVYKGRAVITPVLAQTRYGGQRVSATTDSALLLAAGSWVYGISIFATSANAEMGIYNASSLLATGDPVDEIGEATQYDHADRPWPKPIYFANGVTVIVNNGTGFVDYGPEP